MQPCPRHARFWCNRSQEPSKKGRGQGQSLPNKSLVCSGKLEARDLETFTSTNPMGPQNVRTSGSLGRCWELVRYLRYLVKASHRRSGGDDQLKTQQRLGCA